MQSEGSLNKRERKSNLSFNHDREQIQTTEADILDDQ